MAIEINGDLCLGYFYSFSCVFISTLNQYCKWVHEQGHWVEDVGTLYKLYSKCIAATVADYSVVKFHFITSSKASILLPDSV